ncbi:hypothetical protein INR49_001863 [Caranx melampygus]|nr:hypothetical protein INR49_001863 [Caranx melampygus]
MDELELVKECGTGEQIVQKCSSGLVEDVIWKKTHVQKVEDQCALNGVVTFSVSTAPGQDARRKSSSKSVSHVQARATEAMAEPGYIIPVFRERTAEETEEYQRVSANVGKGLAVIQEELHRMRMATKAQVDSLEIQREGHDDQEGELLDDIPKMPDFLVALRPHTVWEKTPVKLFCTVEGHPRPIVKWYKGGMPVDPLNAPGKYKIENKYGVHSLIISRYV